jgi:hypothetical protein
MTVRQVGNSQANHMRSNESMQAMDGRVEVSSGAVA